MDFILDMFDGEKKDKDSKKEGKKSKDVLKPKDIAKQRDAFCKSKRSTYKLFYCCSFVQFNFHHLLVLLLFYLFITLAGFRRDSDFRFQTFSFHSSFSF